VPADFIAANPHLNHPVPKSVGLLINLGNISVQLKDFTSARKYFEEALKLEPNGQYAQEAKEQSRKLKKK
jgi:Tfp pilus assembly protein PilF